MPASIHRTANPQPSAGREIIGFGDYVERQLSKVRTYVRLSDLAVAIVTCAVIVGALLFLSIVVDHWIVDLGRFGRFAVLAAMLGTTVYFLVTQVVPLIAKRMNPAYVANIIEKSDPSLKNSLLNFVFFRSNPVGIRKVVFEAVERQAATDLARVDVDATIDRTPLIRIGSALGAIMLAFVVYAILSPKDPLATVARVLVPWTDRARPSRVEISNVEPGTTSVYSGHQLNVTATIRNLRNDEQAILLYSTTDGQVVDAALSLQPIERAPNGERDSNQALYWHTLLPKSTDGLHQDVTYRIVAGDAIAGPYRVKVIPAPSIVVRQLEYAYPAYMRRESVVVADAGEINAVEGTRVTIRANANQPIEFAYVEFDADTETTAKDLTSASTSSSKIASPRQTVTMQHDGQNAWATFTVKLNADRRTPWHTSYQVRFRNREKAINDRPAQYGIQVTPDIDPVVEILTPATQAMDLAVNATQMIEVRALDPDYGLEQILLKAIARNSDRTLEKQLFQSPTPDKPVMGQQVVKFAFQPNKVGFLPGDIVDYQAIAADNRVDPTSGNPAPNISKTPTYQFRVTPANANAQNGGEPENEQKQNQQGDQGQPADEPNGDANNDNVRSEDNANTENNGAQAEAGDNNGQAPNGENQDPSQGNKGQQNKPDEAHGDQSDEANRGDQNNSRGNQTNDGQTNDGKTSDGHTSDDANGNDQTGADQTADEQKSEGKNGERTSRDSQSTDKQPIDRPADQNETRGEESEQNGDDGKRGEQSQNKQDANDPSNDRSDEASDSSDGERKSADPSDANSSQRDTKDQDSNSTEDLDQEPLPSDGSRDGDAMKRILEQIRERKGQQPEPNQREQRPCENCTDGSCQSCQQGQTKPGSKSGKPTDKEKGSDNPTERNPSTGNTNPTSDPQDSQGPQPNPDGTTPDDAQSPAGPSPNAGSDDQSDSNSGQQPGNQDGEKMDGQLGDPAGQDANNQRSQPKQGQGSQSNQSDPEKATQTDGNPGQQGDQSDANNPSESTGDPQAGGNDNRNHPEQPTDIEGDKANLDYAREATDLVLDFLNHQDARRDRELLDRLGWSPEQLAKFRERWAQMKQDAERNDPVGVSAKRELDEVLRSLGLTPTADRLRGGSEDDDNIQAGNSGRRSKPPAAYRQRYERFLKSVQGSK